MKKKEEKIKLADLQEYRERNPKEGQKAIDEYFFGVWHKKVKKPKQKRIIIDENDDMM